MVFQLLWNRILEAWMNGKCTQARQVMCFCSPLHHLLSRDSPTRKQPTFCRFDWNFFFPPFQEVYTLYNFQFHVAVITWWTRSPRWVSDQCRLQIGSDKQTSYLAAGPLASDAFLNKLRITEWLSNGFTGRRHWLIEQFERLAQVGGCKLCKWVVTWQ